MKFTIGTTLSIAGIVVVGFCIPGGLDEVRYWIAMFGCVLVSIGNKMD